MLYDCLPRVCYTDWVVKRLIFPVLFVFVLGFFFTVPADAQIYPTEPVKVGYVGDVGIRDDSIAMMRMMREQGVDIVVIPGDFDYLDRPDQFLRTLNDNLGRDIPILITVGNHDVGRWGGSDGYQQLFVQRLQSFPEVQCQGDFGIKSVCTFRGIRFILSGIGTLGDNHVPYLQSALAESSEYYWPVCVWHKNQTAMQVGSKRDEVGWDAYRLCRQYGAMIITGHEHTYERTKSLKSMEFQLVADGWNDPTKSLVAPNISFAVVTGAGGEGLRDQERCNPTTYPYGCNGEWAKILTTDNGLKAGAFIVTYHTSGPRKALGQYVSKDNEIMDQFEITSQNGPEPVEKTCALTVSSATVAASEPISIRLNARSTRANSEIARVFVSKTDGSRLQPLPSGFVEAVTNNRYFYQLPIECQTGAGQACSLERSVELPPGQSYRLHCDLPSEPNKCSGNPDCDYNGGLLSCSASGWGHCSTTDSIAVTVRSAPSPTPPSVPGDVDTDGDVDIFDYNQIISSFGQLNCAINVTGSCVIDIFDYNTVVSNFGRRG